jgi:uroporphyrinogen decarboxylase
VTTKERFMRTLTFEPVDEPLSMEITLWAQTRERWLSEGMPEDLNTSFMHRGEPYFGLEGYETLALDATSPRPAVEYRELEEGDDHLLFVDGFGRTRRARKSGTVGGTRMSMDTYLDFPVKDLASFREYRFRYEGPVEERYPPDWEAVKRGLQASELPLTLMNPLGGTFGYYSMLRNWIGTENLSYLWYDDPTLIHECLEFLTDFILRVLERAVTEVAFDFVIIHEDMAGKGGPLMGPKLFGEFLLPHYRRYIEFLRGSSRSDGHGVRLVLVDTDGDHSVLIPVFLEAGVDGFCPMERAAGMDPVQVRREYGHSVCMMGGVDKREVAKGPAAIEAELAHLAPVIAGGGYLPTIDHAIHPDVSYEDFLYYLAAKRRILGSGE